MENWAAEQKEKIRIINILKERQCKTCTFYILWRDPIRWCKRKTERPPDNVCEQWQLYISEIVQWARIE